MPQWRMRLQSWSAFHLVSSLSSHIRFVRVEVSETFPASQLCGSRHDRRRVPQHACALRRIAGGRDKPFFDGNVDASGDPRRVRLFGSVLSQIRRRHKGPISRQRSEIEHTTSDVPPLLVPRLMALRAQRFDGILTISARQSALAPPRDNRGRETRCHHDEQKRSLPHGGPFKNSNSMGPASTGSA